MKLTDAQTIASQLVDLLRPACVKVEIAGSVRRQKPEVKDIEIVVLPTMSVPDRLSLFQDLTVPIPETEPAALREELWHLLQTRVLEYDMAVKRNGDKCMRFIVRPSGIVLDLFIADEKNYGNILAIRTGDSEFSKMLVTQRRLGGLMPSYLKRRDGYLWNGIDLICCPTELDYFEALGVAWVEPRERCGETAGRLSRMVAGGKL